MWSQKNDAERKEKSWSNHFVTIREKKIVQETFYY